MMIALAVTIGILFGFAAGSWAGWVCGKGEGLREALDLKNPALRKLQHERLDRSTYQPR